MTKERRVILRKKGTCRDLFIAGAKPLQNCGGDARAPLGGVFPFPEHTARDAPQAPSGIPVFHVHADADNGIGEPAALHVERRLCQNAADLSAVQKNVVHPLDRRLLFATSAIASQTATAAQAVIKSVSAAENLGAARCSHIRRCPRENRRGGGNAPCPRSAPPQELPSTRAHPHSRAPSPRRLSNPCSSARSAKIHVSEIFLFRRR